MLVSPRISLCREALVRCNPTFVKYLDLFCCKNIPVQSDYSISSGTFAPTHLKFMASQPGNTAPA